MQLTLPTKPDFLRKTFPQVRQRLGESVLESREFKIDHDQGIAGDVTVFSGRELTLSEKLKKLSASLKNQPRREEVVQQQPRLIEQQPILATQDTIPSYASQTKMQKKPLSKKLVGSLLSAMVVLSLVVGAILLVPAAYYAFFPADVIEVTPPEKGTAFGGDFDQPIEKPVEPAKYQPPVDETLPEGDWLIIPRIGVRSQLRPTADPEEALAKGLWWVPDFGKPGDEDLPIIVAGHRYGWQWWWKDDYWKYHSFYLLPDTQPGDRIEIISNQQKWVYEIYAGEEGDEITDYNGDLILYTCKYLTGPIRHFRYARLIDPTTNTQATQVN